MAFLQVLRPAHKIKRDNGRSCSRTESAGKPSIHAFQSLVFNLVREFSARNAEAWDDKLQRSCRRIVISVATVCALPSWLRPNDRRGLWCARPCVPPPNVARRYASKRHAAPDATARPGRRYCAARV